jgi:hypothetical protein
MVQRTCIQTAGRRLFDLANPSFEGRDHREVIREIAFHLAHTNRFAGAVGEYSVAQHSIHVAQVVAKSVWESQLTDEGSYGVVLSALLHDAHEAYCGDVSSPMKVVLGDAWRAAERKIQEALEDFFGVQCNLPTIKRADQILYATEARDLHIGGPIDGVVSWYDVEPLPGRIEPWGPRTSERAFIRVFSRLTNGEF